MRMKSLVFAILGALILTATAVAARPPTLTFELDQAEPVDVITFTVERDGIEKQSPGRRHSNWVTVDCYDADGEEIWMPDDDRVVIWGFWNSLTGHTTPLATTGETCTAWLTDTPWRPKKSDPQITFQVASFLS